MKKRTGLVLAILAAICLAAFADQILFINFENETIGAPPSNWWTSGNGVQVVQDPTGGQRGKVLYVSDATPDGNATITAYPLPTSLTGNATVQMDIYGINTQNKTNTSWWLSNGTAANTRRAGLGYDVPNANFEWFTFERSGSTDYQREFQQTNNFGPNTWYTVKIDVFVDTTDTFRIQIIGGNFTNWTQLSTTGNKTEWNFRNGPVTALTHLWFSSFGGNNSVTTDGLYVDNIAVYSPIPEPSSIMLGIMAVAVGVGIRRIRRMAA